MLIAVAAGASVWRERAIGIERASGPVLPGFSERAAEAARVRVTTAEGAFTLARGAGDVWTMPERGGHRVDERALQGLARGLSTLRLRARRGEAAADHARLGVGDPPADGAARVRVETAAGQVLADVMLAAPRPDAPRARHVRRMGEATTFLAEGDLPPLDRAAGFLDLAVIDVAPEAIASVEAQVRGEAYAIVRRPDGGLAPVDGAPNPNATAAALALTRWRPLDVRPAADLTAPPVAVHATRLRDGTTIEARAHDGGDGGGWIVLSAGGPGAAAINARAAGWAYRLSAYDFADFVFSRASALGETLAPEAP